VPRHKFIKRMRWLLCIAGLPFAVALLGGSAAQTPQLPVRIPSNVAWTEDTLDIAANGDPFRGLLLARRCEHCHGVEGFSNNLSIPNLASVDKLVIYKQLDDFRSHKRPVAVMQEIAASLSPRDSADLAAYFSMLPTTPDRGDKRVYPQPAPDPAHVRVAARLIASGDPQRGLPACDVCHGPIAVVRGAPLLTYQNRDYLLHQLDGFATGTRANDINVRMRSIAGMLTEDERGALADYYGSGLGTVFLGPPYNIE